MTKDIFKTNLELPATVCILACGPNGIKHWGRCEHYTIAVNRAVMIDSPRTDALLVADSVAVTKDWWEPSKQINTTRIFSEGVAKMDTTIQPDYTFKHHRLGWFDDIPKPVETEFTARRGRLNCTGTISGVAIEMAVRCGANEIFLCGVDFHGSTHWDGGTAPCPLNSRDGNWDIFMPYMNSLIKWAKDIGVEIYSYSPTAIDVEVI